jgi:hypothetical protein
MIAIDCWPSGYGLTILTILTPQVGRDFHQGIPRRDTKKGYQEGIPRGKGFELVKKRNHHPPAMPLAGRFSHRNLWNMAEQGQKFSRQAPPRLESPDWACLHGNLAKPVRGESGGKTLHPLKCIPPSALRSSDVTDHVSDTARCFLG